MVVLQVLPCHQGTGIPNRCVYDVWGAAVIGYLGAKLPVWMRVLAMVASFTLIAALPITDEIGFALSVVFGYLAWRNVRTVKGKLQPA